MATKVERYEGIDGLKAYSIIGIVLMHVLVNGEYGIGGFVYAGLLCCQDTDYVYIHDGARPFITEEMVLRGYEAVKRTNACVMGMPSKDTVKLADSSGYIKETPDRKIVWNIQTPQIFLYELIRKSYENIRQKDMSNVTDDAMVVEQESGRRILLVEGSYRNIKITTPEDLAVAEAFLRY